ncbi:MAG: STAS domain-containing protein [Bacteroidetes bacterium]|nr:STAS domain-containing protein [Bacteroidota bacterium]
MKFELDEQDSHTILRVKEEKLNSVVAPNLKAEIVLLINKGRNNLIFDLSEVKFVDSSGLSALLIAHRLCNNANGTFVISELQENVSKLINISQLDNIMNITSTVSEAIDQISGGGSVDKSSDNGE